MCRLSRHTFDLHTTYPGFLRSIRLRRFANRFDKDLRVRAIFSVVPSIELARPRPPGVPCCSILLGGLIVGFARARAADLAKFENRVPRNFSPPERSLSRTSSSFLSLFTTRPSLEPCLSNAPPGQLYLTTRTLLLIRKNSKKRKNCSRRNSRLPRASGRTRENAKALDCGRRSIPR